MRALVLAFACILLAGCGVDLRQSNADAIDTLQRLPMMSVAPIGDPYDASYEQLEAALTELAPQDNSTRGLFGRKATSFSNLRNLFSLLNNGQPQTVDSLAYGLVQMNNGSVVQTATSLGGILDIIKAIGPIIGSIFPGLNPIIQALLTILPAILSLFGG
ncbi:MAG: hypothetical protein KDD51_09040 [Bdellovibrionales bacterium]|nr:hypothetical protein [Bdellovibrionales bacterium]